METPASTLSEPSTSAASSTTSGTTMEETKVTTPTSNPPGVVSLSTNAADKQDDSSKLKTLLSILRKFIGVSDMANVRFSLPAQLLEPTPNLEYWNYLERPETFTSIPDAPTDLGRLLAVLRFWFTKDLKYVRGRPCKPYNSTLGEFFRCSWTVEETLPPVLDAQDHPVIAENPLQTSQQNLASPHPLKLAFLTEQTSHHPPISAYHVSCPDKHITARGFDQISAKFTGTSIKVTPGEHNHGIFINLEDRGEEYQLTHPVAQLGGLLKGTLSISVADVCYITCPRTRLKVILNYLDDGWLSKAQHKVEGVIFRYDPENDTIKTAKDVPEQDLLGRIDGSWKDTVYFVLTGGERTMLLSVQDLVQVAKTVPVKELQLPNESRRVWANVTDAILSKQYSKATALKNEVEDRQRAKAKEREASGARWQPRFFAEAKTADGRPTLTADGQEAVGKIIQGDWKLKESTVYAA